MQIQDDGKELVYNLWHNFYMLSFSVFIANVLLIYFPNCFPPISSVFGSSGCVTFENVPSGLQKIRAISKARGPGVFRSDWLDFSVD